jgi:hypothetical protein
VQGFSRVGHVLCAAISRLPDGAFEGRFQRPIASYACVAAAVRRLVVRLPQGMAMSRRVFSIGVCSLLVVLFVQTVWVVLSPERNDAWYGYGGEFIQFYTAGSLVNSGNADRLYDQEYFRSVQRPLVGSKEGQYSVYPPITALAVSPIARLPYAYALACWWGLVVVCTAAAGWLLYRMLPWEGSRRWMMLLALAGIYPCSLAIISGHLVAVLLLIVVAGFALHRGEKRVLAGCVFSLLALKPQFAAGIFLWLLLRRDTRALLGVAIGLATQAIAVALCLGSGVLLTYIEDLPRIAQIVKRITYTPDFEHSFAEIVAGLARNLGVEPRAYGNWFLLAQVAAAGLAIFCVFGMAQTRQNRLESEAEPERSWRYEYAAAGLLMLALPPYLLLYDLLLLAVPIMLLWSSPRWPLGVALYLSATVLGSAVYVRIGFSLVPFLVLLALCELRSRTRPCGAACGGLTHQTP